MTTNNPSSPTQRGEEMVKRILAVAKLLSKGSNAQSDRASARKVPKDGTKTQRSKSEVSS